MKQNKFYIISEEILNQLDEVIIAIQNIFCEIFSNHEVDVKIQERMAEIIRLEDFKR